jgi:hypothetical protein
MPSSRAGSGIVVAASARQVGRRLGWVEDLRALLAGRAVREAEPETLALERALAAFGRRVADIGPGMLGELSVAVSHDGQGPGRGVTVTVSALLRPPPPQAEA